MHVPAQVYSVESYAFPESLFWFNENKYRNNPKNWDR